MSNKEKTNKKSFKELERVVRGYSNHRRIEILELLAREPELSVFEVAEKLNINFKTASEHMRRLAIAGLLMKRAAAQYVRHKLTNRGNVVLMFLRTLE